MCRGLVYLVTTKNRAFKTNSSLLYFLFTILSILTIIAFIFVVVEVKSLTYIDYNNNQSILKPIYLSLNWCWKQRSTSDSAVYSIFSTLDV